MMDRDLELAVLNALYLLEPMIDVSRVAVTARGGVATLTGEVDAQTQKLAARYKAQCVRGVKEVVDQIEVRVPARVEQRTDDIAANVLNALYWDVAVPADRVSARCEKGWVTLTGEVDRPYQKSSAEADVRKIRGVIGVTNAITVGADAARKADQAILLAKAKAPIAAPPQTNAGPQAPLS